MQDISDHGESGEQEQAQDWQCGPFGFWPVLAYPQGVSWGYAGDSA
jgi:hypothetical protein